MDDLLAFLLQRELERLTALSLGDIRPERGYRPLAAGDDVALVHAAVALFEIVAARSAIDSAELARSREWLAAAGSTLRELGKDALPGRRARPLTPNLVSNALSAMERASNAIASVRPTSSAPPPSVFFSVTIGSGGRWFAVERSPAVELRRRPTLARLLWTLTLARKTNPGRCLPADEVVACVWPGERMAAGAAKNRLYFAVHALRSLGLRDLVVSREGGYFIPAYVEVRVDDGRELPI